MHRDGTSHRFSLTVRSWHQSENVSIREATSVTCVATQRVASPPTRLTSDARPLPIDAETRTRQRSGGRATRATGPAGRGHHGPRRTPAVSPSRPKGRKAPRLSADERLPRNLSGDRQRVEPSLPRTRNVVHGVVQPSKGAGGRNIKETAS